MAAEEEESFLLPKDDACTEFWYRSPVSGSGAGKEGFGRRPRCLGARARVGLGAFAALALGLSGFAMVAQPQRNVDAVEGRGGGAAGSLPGAEEEVADWLPLASEDAAAVLTLKVSALNAYGDVGGLGQGAYPWLQGALVLEPHKPTTLEATTATPNAAKTKATTHAGAVYYSWRIVADDGGGGGGDVVLESHGSHGDAALRVEWTCSEAGTAYSAHLVAKDAVSGAVVGSVRQPLRCLYVRREVRALREEDRSAFLDAMVTLWRLDTHEGRKMYGAGYTGMDKFVAVHADQATADIGCDRWHEGSGFLVHHLAQSVSFEMALRSVDPRVTTPYWDFSVEGEALYTQGKGPKALAGLSPLFSATWFGSTDDLSHVVDGRWQHMPALQAKSEDTVHNSYGLVRAPWNNHRDGELTRHMADVCGLEPVNKPVPTCATHFKVMNLTSLGAFQTQVAGYGHGPMHVNTGGVFGECTGALRDIYDKYSDEMAQVLTMKEINARVEAVRGYSPGWHTDTKFTFRMMMEKYIHLEYFHIYRTLWRSQTCALDGEAGLLQCPDSCDPHVPEDECKCTCKGISDGTFDWKNAEPCLYSSDTSRTIFGTIVSESLRKDLVTMFCSVGVKEGEQLESASPADPLFWMIHPILDRMTQAKRLAGVSAMKYGGFGAVPPLEDEDWLEYSYYTTEDYTCEGHGPYDAVLDHMALPRALIQAGDANGDGALSNLEFWSATDPALDMGHTYIYGDFDWSHCSPGDVKGGSGDDKWAFDTGYDQGGGGGGSASGSEADIYTFQGGINPLEWQGEPYTELKPPNHHQGASTQQQPSGQQPSGHAAGKEGAGRRPEQEAKAAVAAAASSSTSVSGFRAGKARGEYKGHELKSNRAEDQQPFLGVY